MIDLRTKDLGTNLGRRDREVSYRRSAWIVEACAVCGLPSLLVKRDGRWPIYAHAMDERGFRELHTRKHAYWNFATTETGKRLAELTTSTDWELLSARSKIEVRNALKLSIVPSFYARAEVEHLLAEKLKWPDFETVERIEDFDRRYGVANKRETK